MSPVSNTSRSAAYEMVMCWYSTDRAGLGLTTGPKLGPAGASADLPSATASLTTGHSVGVQT